MCSSHINHCCPHSRSVVLMPAPQGQGQCCQSQPKVHIHDSPKGFLRQVFPFPTTDAIFSFSFWVQHFFGGKPSLKTLLFSQSWFPPAANQAAVVPVTKVLLATILEGTLQPRLWRKVLEIMFPSTRVLSFLGKRTCWPFNTSTLHSNSPVASIIVLFPAGPEVPMQNYYQAYNWCRWTTRERTPCFPDSGWGFSFPKASIYSKAAFHPRFASKGLTKSASSKNIALFVRGKYPPQPPLLYHQKICFF